MRIQISKKQDLINVLGQSIATSMLSTRSDSMKRLPQSVKFVDVKPVFNLNDGSTLTAYAVDLETGRIEGEHYCGSGASAINHMGEQFSEGFEAPLNKALIFVETYWNGRNTSWTLTVVSKQITKQVG